MYADGMNTLSKLPTEPTHLRGLTLILTEDKARSQITELIAALILHHSLFVLAASEWLPAYELTRLIRQKTLEVRPTLDRLYTVRVSTCHRLLDSLTNIPSKGEPVLVLDFRHTFYDSDISLHTRLIRLRECCRELARLAFYRPVIVITQAMEGKDYDKFIPALSPIANKTLILEHDSEPIPQPTLF